MSQMPLVIYRDDEVMALVKPAGMPTHPGRGCREVQSLLQWARGYLGRHVYPVHRLDRATSGLVLMATSPESAAVYGQLVRGGELSKTYHALVRGWPPDDGCIDKPLAKVSGFSFDTAVPVPASTMNPAAPKAALLPACTYFRTVKRWQVAWPVRPYPSSRYALVELRPTTGRTHQLRRHLHSLAHPILGDTRYGDGAHNAAIREHLGCRQLMLHAQALAFVHPQSGANVSLVADYDQLWQQVLSGLEAHSLPGPQPV